MGRPSKYDAKTMCQTVIECMRDGRSIIEVCAKVGITRDTFYRWYKEIDKKEFKEAVDIGKVLSEAYWDNIGRLGILGQIDNFKHAAWIYRMKCRFRDRWNDVQESKIELTTHNQDMSNDEIKEKIASILNQPVTDEDIEDDDE